METTNQFIQHYSSPETVAIPRSDLKHSVLFTFYLLSESIIHIQNNNYKFLDTRASGG